MASIVSTAGIRQQVQTIFSTARGGGWGGGWTALRSISVPDMGPNSLPQQHAENTATNTLSGRPSAAEIGAPLPALR